MTELAQVRSLVEVLLRKVDGIERHLAAKEAPLTRPAFAKLTGLSLSTVCRRIEAGDIQVGTDNRIPYSEARRYLS